MNKPAVARSVEQWAKLGRSVIKGVPTGQFTNGAPVFTRDQTVPTKRPEASEQKAERYSYKHQAERISCWWVYSYEKFYCAVSDEGTASEICAALNRAPVQANAELVAEIESYYEDRGAVSYTPKELIKFQQSIIMDALLQRALIALQEPSK